MSINFKDYYQTLGVSKDASAETMKKAFRELARQHHPDKVQGDDKISAETRFKEINEAYEVLKDPEKREKYDLLGADWDQPQRRARHGRAGGGFGGDPFGGGGTEFHFGGTGYSDFFEQFFGMGSDPSGGVSRRRSDPFGGMGRSARGRDVEAEIMVTLEEVLNGSNRQISLRKVDPETGQEQKQTFQVRIPKGVHADQRIRLAGQGGEGSSGGPTGDLFLKVRYSLHPDFRVEGDRLFYDLDLAPWEAALGTQVELHTLDRRVNLKIKSGSQSGQQLRLSGQGLPNRDGTRGHLHVVLHVRVPEKLSENERSHWEALAEESTFRPRG